jgi:hypothetical protein
MNDYVLVDKEKLFYALENRSRGCYLDFLDLLSTDNQIDFLETYKDELDWKDISEHSSFNIKVYRKFMPYFYWRLLPYQVYSRFSEKFMRELISFLEKTRKSVLPEALLKSYVCNRKVSEKFLKDFLKYLDGNTILYNQEVSEDFIENTINYMINWNYVSWRQNLSEEFYIRHVDKIDLYGLERNRKIPKEVKKRVIALKKLLESD